MIEQRLQFFLKNKTYTFIKDVFNYHFNGYIIKIEKDKIWFTDDKAGQIPILKEEIKEVNYSTR